jgi:hypothetical protein
MQLLLRAANAREAPLTVATNATVRIVINKILSELSTHFGISHGDTVVLYIDTFRLQDTWLVRDLVNPSEDETLVLVRVCKRGGFLPPSPRREPNSAALRQLIDMGFDREAAAAALAQTGDDVSRAALVISSGDVAPAPSPAPRRGRPRSDARPGSPAEIISGLLTDFPGLDADLIRAILDASGNDAEAARTQIAIMMAQ